MDANRKARTPGGIPITLSGVIPWRWKIWCSNVAFPPASISFLPFR